MAIVAKAWNMPALTFPFVLVTWLLLLVLAVCILKANVQRSLVDNPTIPAELIREVDLDRANVYRITSAAITRTVRVPDPDRELTATQ